MLLKLLRHPIPFPDENLANYLRRLSDANYCTLPQLYKLLGIRLNIKAEDLVYYLENFRIEPILKATGYSTNAIRDLTIDHYELFNTLDIIITGRRHSRELLHETNKYCPLCLKESSYLRLYWMIDCIELCINHNTELIDRCPNCNHFLTIEEINNSSCYSCKLDLSEIKPIYCNNKLVLNNQLRVYRAFGVKHKKVHYNNSFPLDLDSLGYIELIIFLRSLIKPDYGLFKRFNYNYINTCSRNSKLMYIIYIEMIIAHWPNALRILLDDINDPDK